MVKVFYYRDKNDKSIVEDYLEESLAKDDKTSRIKATKILDYIDYLGEHGNQAREPYVKKLESD